MSRPKELHYFSREMAFMNTNHILGMKWYQSRFAHCPRNSILGEISPSYLFDREAPIRIKKQFPNSKIIIQLRNPVDSVFSYYKHGTCTYNLEDTFEDFLEQNSYFKRIFLYAEQVERYLYHFNRSNIHFIVSDDIRNSPQVVLKNVYDFLGVRYHRPKNMNVIVNACGAYRSKLLRDFLFGAKALMDKSKPIEYTYKRLGMDNLGLKLVKLNRTYNIPKSDMHPDTRNKLLAYYRESNEKLSKLTGVDTSSWMK